MKIAEIQVSYKQTNADLLSFNSVETAAETIRPFFEDVMQYKEVFKAVFLSRDYNILGIDHTATGGLSGVSVDIKQIIAIALKGNASAILVAHNHPSGQLQPSHSDIKLTQRLKEACSFFDIALLDHIIFTNQSYYSFTEEGLLECK